ncbi:MAG: hypothetical protein AAF718_06860 [Pseudomonadota bacterium]
MSDPRSNRVEAMTVWMTERGPAILCGFGASFIAAGILDGMATASETQSGASHMISLAHLPAGLCLLLWGIAFSKNAPNGKLYALLALVFTPLAFFVNTESMLFGNGPASRRRCSFLEYR